MSTAIVGAGAAGLSLALMLNDDVTLFERSDTAGGLCRSYCVNGFTFDTGPHILSGIPHAVEWIQHSTGIEFLTGNVNNRAWWNGHFEPHPFEEEKDVRTYMAKMWKVKDLDELSLPGLGAQPGRKPGGSGSFTYPAHGGYQAITDAWARQLEDKICYRTPDYDVRNWEDYDRVVWTAPVSGDCFRYNSLVTVTCGYRGMAPPYTAIYVPHQSPYHRITFPTAFSPNNAPDGHFSVQAELTITPDFNDPHVMERLVVEFNALVAHMGVCSGDPVMTDIRITTHAYPVPTPESVEFEYVESEWVFRHGRSGAFKYLNLDGVVAASMELAEKLNGVRVATTPMTTEWDL